MIHFTPEELAAIQAAARARVQMSASPGAGGDPHAFRLWSDLLRKLDPNAKPAGIFRA